MSRYEWLKKHRPTTPLDEDEILRRAARARRAASTRTSSSAPARSTTRRNEPNRTHRKTTKSAQNSAKSAFADPSPRAKRTHDDGGGDRRDPCQSANLPLASSAPKIHATDDAIRDGKIRSSTHGRVEDGLRKRCTAGRPQGQDRRHHRLRQPGARARTEHARQRPESHRRQPQGFAQRPARDRARVQPDERRGRGQAGGPRHHHAAG